MFPAPMLYTCRLIRISLVQLCTLANFKLTDVTSSAIRCNGRLGITSKCSVVAGQTVTVEMHQQPGDRSCINQAIGGNHYGPVTVYLSKVTDASTADGSAGWFKIFQDGWAPVCKLQ
jgi:cellulase